MGKLSAPPRKKPYAVKAAPAVWRKLFPFFRKNYPVPHVVGSNPTFARIEIKCGCRLVLCKRDNWDNDTAFSKNAPTCHFFVQSSTICLCFIFSWPALPFGQALFPAPLSHVWVLLWLLRSPLAFSSCAAPLGQSNTISTTGKKPVSCAGLCSFAPLPRRGTGHGGPRRAHRGPRTLGFLHGLPPVHAGLSAGESWALSTGLFTGPAEVRRAKGTLTLVFFLLCWVPNFSPWHALSPSRRLRTVKGSQDRPVPRGFAGENC